MDLLIVFPVLSSVDRMIHQNLTLQVYWYPHLDECIRAPAEIWCSLGFLWTDEPNVC